jgi:hypothetical protein
MATSRHAAVALAGILLCSLPATLTAQGPAAAAPPVLDANFNGIVAGEPKIYDDRSLDQMLQAYQAQLAQLKAFDNPTLINRLGTLQGGSSQQSSFAAQATGRATPDLTSTVTTGTNAGTQAVAKRAGLTPAVPTIGDSGAAALPSSFSTSASDALGEEARLAFDIANLRLLLQESLSDRYRTDPADTAHTISMQKRSVTVGIPISIESVPHAKGAVAEVEVFFTVESGSPPPGVITLLPREESYNVAAIKDKSVSLGAGAVIASVINVGVNWLGRKQAYYIVKAIDTVAMQRQTAADSRTAALAWQFRPVLGEPSVHPGLRQVFVRLSYESINDNRLGTVWVRTTWRHYDPASGVVGKPACAKVWTRSYTLLDVGRRVKGILSWRDLGNGQVAVTYQSGFPPGTSVLVPEGYLADGSPGFQLTEDHLLFNLSAAQLVRPKVGALVSINDLETDLSIESGCSPALAQARARIASVNVGPYNAAQSRVTVELKPDDVTNFRDEPPLIRLGTHVYGLSDAPLRWEGIHVDDLGYPAEQGAFFRWQKVSFVAATDDLRQARMLSLAHPFCGARFYDSYPLDLPSDFVAAQAATLGSGDAGVVIGITGQNLAGTTVLVNDIPAEVAPPGGANIASWMVQQPATAKAMAGRAAMGGAAHAAAGQRAKAPGSVKPAASGGAAGTPGIAPVPCGRPVLDQDFAPTMLVLRVPACLTAGLKAIVVARAGGAATTLAIDAGDAKPTIKQPDPVPQVVAAGDKRIVKLTGTNLSLIQDVQYNGASLQPSLAPDQSYISIVLPDAIATVPNLYLLVAIAKDKAKTQVPVVVTVAAPPKAAS